MWLRVPGECNHVAESPGRMQSCGWESRENTINTHGYSYTRNRDTFTTNNFFTYTTFMQAYRIRFFVNLGTLDLTSIAIELIILPYHQHIKNEMIVVFRPRFCICKAILCRGQPGLMIWNLSWIMLLMQDQSLELFTSRPARYHCATDAPFSPVPL